MARQAGDRNGNPELLSNFAEQTHRQHRIPPLFKVVVVRSQIGLVQFLPPEIEHPFLRRHTDFSIQAFHQGGLGLRSIDSLTRDS